jgi:hypothetical protein
MKVSTHATKLRARIATIKYRKQNRAVIIAEENVRVETLFPNIRKKKKK